ncbi:MAG: lamin tail domain-containing protein, partial [Anaerolineales bacterium]|nr:lamin tail domain-containing protein [Anaerolineales bacterium]
HWFISDSSDDYVKYQIPAATMIAGNGFALFDESDFNSAGNPFRDFGLSSSKGDDLYLLEADAAGNLLRFVDTAEFGPTPNGESIGLLPDGEGDFVRLCQLSWGSSNSNSGFCHGPVVINEIHYNPAGADDNVEFIELMNFGNATESFDNWQLRGDVDLDFAAGLTLAPQEALLIVAFDPLTDTVALDNFRTTYRLDTAVQIIGPWQGNRLDNGGGAIKLYRPDEPPAGETFYPMLLEDMVEYDDDPPWPTEPDSGGPSLELINWQVDNRQPSNWEPSLSSLGTPGRDNRDDHPPISAADVLVYEHMATAEFTVSLAYASGLTVTVDYNTAAGSATAVDFIPTSGTLTFAPGETSQTAAVAILNDGQDEPLEQFTLLLSNPTNGYLADDTAVGSISDDDDPPTLSINDVSVVEGDSNTTTAVFSVTLSASSSYTITADYNIQAQTATAAEDYLSAAGTLTFAPGETAQTIAITVLGDIVVEDDETFVVMLSNAANATLADDSGLGTIIDNEGIPTLFIEDVQLVEGNAGSQTAVFTVQLNLAADETITVAYTTADGDALAGEDYTAASGQLTFTAGTLSQTITVTILGDELVEADETFLVQLSNATNGALISDGQALGTILNDDSRFSVYVPFVLR